MCVEWWSWLVGTSASMFLTRVYISRTVTKILSVNFSWSFNASHRSIILTISGLRTWDIASLWSDFFLRILWSCKSVGLAPNCYAYWVVLVILRNISFAVAGSEMSYFRKSFEDKAHSEGLLNRFIPRMSTTNLITCNPYEIKKSQGQLLEWYYCRRRVHQNGAIADGFWIKNTVSCCLSFCTVALCLRTKLNFYVSSFVNCKTTAFLFRTQETYLFMFFGYPGRPINEFGCELWICNLFHDLFDIKCTFNNTFFIAEMKQKNADCETEFLESPRS